MYRLVGNATVRTQAGSLVDCLDVTGAQEVAVSMSGGIVPQAQLVKAIASSVCARPRGFRGADRHGG